MEYIRRVVDQIIDRRIKAFNAINITGPKGCRKTRTCKERCRTVIEFQDEGKRNGYLQIADTSPDLFSVMKNRFYLTNGRTLRKYGALLEKTVMIILRNQALII